MHARSIRQDYRDLHDLQNSVCSLLWQLLASEHSRVRTLKSKESCHLTRPNVLTQQIRGVQRRMWTTDTLKNQLA